jgi:hypothetical protein
MTLILEDPYHQSLDPISKLVEPLTSLAYDIGKWINSLDKEFKIKDIISLSLDDERMSLKRLMSPGGLVNEHESVEYYVQNLWNTMSNDIRLNFHDVRTADINCVTSAFRLEFPAYECSRSFTVSANEFKIKDNCKLVCDVVSWSEKRVKAFYLEEIRHMIPRPFSSLKQKNMNQLLDMFSLMIKSTQNSKNLKCRNIFEEIHSLIASDTWRFRSTTAMVKLYEVIADYMIYGQEADLAALIELKLKIKHNKPIYTLSR